MPDPIIPTRAGTITASVPREEYTRTNVNVGGPTDRTVESSGGLGTGMLVAGVFVVIALLAIFMFNDRNGDANNSDPSVSIENTNVPAADPAPAPAPVAPAPAPAPVPDTGTVAPVLPAPDPATTTSP